MSKVSRRTILASATLVPLAAVKSVAQETTTVFQPPQMQILQAFIDRLIPSDEHGPGAVEAGVANYFDQALATHLIAEKGSVLAGLATVDSFARAQYGGPFAQLEPGKRDEILTALENDTVPGFNPNSRTFFIRMRQLTLEGMFCDPFYGGNQAFRGWDLIRYPGPRLAVSANEQNLRDPIKPLRASAYGTNRRANGH